MQLIRRKTAPQIASMRAAGRVVAEMHDVCTAATVPGASTADLDVAAREVLERRSARSSFLGFPGRRFAFPGVICTSVNDVVVHGLPGANAILREGDIVSIDAGAIVDGWHADAAVTVGVGDLDEIPKRLIAAARSSLDAGVATAQMRKRIGAIGSAIETEAKQAGFTVVREYVGHGIGRSMHEPPEIPNWGSPGQGVPLRRGMTLAIEPLLNAGGAATRLREDGWTVATADGALSAHFEHTIAIGESGPEILTHD